MAKSKKSRKLPRKIGRPKNTLKTLEPEVKAKETLTKDEAYERLANAQKVLHATRLGPKIFKEGSSILTKECRPVRMTGNHIVNAVKDMKAALDFYGALGIAANQVGHRHRMILVKLSTDEEIPTLMINPVIQIQSEETYESKEGCLSFPGKYIETKRPKKIHVEFIDEYFQQQQIELEDIDAGIVQHEIDHIDGILFTEREYPPEIAKKIEKQIEKGLKENPDRLYFSEIKSPEDFPETDKIILSNEEFDHMMERIENPPEPTEALKEAAKRSKENGTLSNENG